MSEHDEQLRGLGARLAEVSYLAADLASELSRYAGGIEGDPLRLAQVQQRRAQVTALLRNYGATTAEVLAWAGQAGQRLAVIDDSAENLEALEQQIETTRRQVEETGAALSEARREAAGQLAERVTSELRDLAMGSSTVDIAVQPRLVAPGEPDAGGEVGARIPGKNSRDAEGVWLAGREVRPTMSGLDEVAIMLQSGPGMPPRPINKAASGGELSRVMLALELVCADSQVPTYVFDEVDAGVGGAAAVDLGARLATLAESAQVIVVTHLGQVAAFAQRHFVVDKGSSGQVSAATVHAVDGPDRVTEVARMLGGESTSAAAREHAEQLLSRHASPPRSKR